MMRQFAIALCDIATFVLPVGRKPWGNAMAAELVHMDDRAAFAFACGCMLTAARERARDFDTRFVAGLWSVSTVTGLFAILQIMCAVRGVRTLFGGPDGMRDALLRNYGAGSSLIATYELARPIVIGSFFLLSFAHIAAALFLLRAQLRRFLIAWFVAMLIAIVTVAIQLSIFWNLDGLPLEFHALLIQAVALSALLAWSDGRHIHGKWLT